MIGVYLYGVFHRMGVTYATTELPICGKPNNAHITLCDKKTMPICLSRSDIGGQIRYRFFSKIKCRQRVADVMIPNVCDRVGIIRRGIADYDVSVTVPFGVLSVA